MRMSYSVKQYQVGKPKTPVDSGVSTGSHLLEMAPISTSITSETNNLDITETMTLDTCVKKSDNLVNKHDTPRTPVISPRVILLASDF